MLQQGQTLRGAEDVLGSALMQRLSSRAATAAAIARRRRGAVRDGSRRVGAGGRRRNGKLSLRLILVDSGGDIERAVSRGLQLVRVLIEQLMGNGRVQEAVNVQVLLDELVCSLIVLAS